MSPPEGGEQFVNGQLAVSFPTAVGLNPSERRALLGGKGAALAHMTGLDLPVPPGFTLTTVACHRFLQQGWSADLAEALAAGLADLESLTSRSVASPDRPLLVSVRSGAPVSMPGMMDTVLNAGMTVDVARALARATGQTRFAWDTFRRFVRSYSSVVLDAPETLLREIGVRHFGADDGRALGDQALAEAAMEFAEELRSRDIGIPGDPLQQIQESVQAVFRSWNSDRAETYRRVEGIDDTLGTAATVQMMSFGNLGDRSGTGVAFSRDPSTGERVLTGDFLIDAQGEDVVAGTHQTLAITALAERWPELGAELTRVATLLEEDLADLVDVEFTIEDGTLWLLQVRRGKRSDRAALRMAIDMADDPAFPLTRSEAVERVRRILDNPPTQAMPDTSTPDASLLATGVAASPGRAAGVLHTQIDATLAAEARGEAVILVRRETSPSDVAGMAAAKGIVTSLGGLVSHAAVVARSWGLPAVVGVSGLEIKPDGIRLNDRSIPVGTEITVDGSSGTVLLGIRHVDEVDVPETAIIRAWLSQSSDRADQPQNSSVPSGHTFSEEATVHTVGRVLALKGMGTAATIAYVLGTAEADVQPVLDALINDGQAQVLGSGQIVPTASLRDDVGQWYEDAAGRLHQRIEPLMEPFHQTNVAFKELVGQWQLRTVDGREVANDHTDPGYDTQVVGRLRSAIHTDVKLIIAEAALAEPRLVRYLERLEAALAEVEQGQHDMMAHPLKDSYHTVWFELHEELIRLSGRNRADEAAAGRG